MAPFAAGGALAVLQSEPSRRVSVEERVAEMEAAAGGTGRGAAGGGAAGYSTPPSLPPGPIVVVQHVYANVGPDFLLPAEHVEYVLRRPWRPGDRLRKSFLDTSTSSGAAGAGAGAGAGEGSAAKKSKARARGKVPLDVIGGTVVATAWWGVSQEEHMNGRIQVDEEATEVQEVQRAREVKDVTPGVKTPAKSGDVEHEDSDATNRDGVIRKLEAETAAGARTPPPPPSSKEPALVAAAATAAMTNAARTRRQPSAWGAEPWAAVCVRWETPPPPAQAGRPAASNRECGAGGPDTAGCHWVTPWDVEPDIEVRRGGVGARV